MINGVVHHGYPWDLSWPGPWWITHVTLPHVSPLIVLPTALALLVLVYAVAGILWEKMAPSTSRAQPRR